MTQAISPFKSKTLRIARVLPEGERGRPAMDLTSEQKQRARHLANDTLAQYTGEEIHKLVGFTGKLNTFMRLLRRYNIRTHTAWMQRRNLKD